MAGTDKLHVMVGGRPVLQWTVTSMAAAASVRRIIVVAAAERVEALATTPWMQAVGARVVPGGPRRQDSVASGVMASEAGVVLVHDGARPFVAPEVVDAVAEAAREHGAAIPVLPVVDSLKRMHEGATMAVEREGLYRAQTPQGARREILVEAYRQMGQTERIFDDEAALLEAYGVRVTTVPGDAANLKITEPADVEAARALAAHRAGPPRYGAAVDTHPFGPHDGLVLGGITLPDAPRLHGHSDGDAVLHAIADAMLGAAGLPDLGRQFPASDPLTSGIASTELLREVIGLVLAAGGHVASVDVTIIGARPRLGGSRLDEMRAVISGLLAIPPEQVAVKASTGNLSGPEGAGTVITANALVGLVHR